MIPAGRAQRARRCPFQLGERVRGALGETGQVVGLYPRQPGRVSVLWDFADRPTDHPVHYLARSPRLWL